VTGRLAAGETGNPLLKGTGAQATAYQTGRAQPAPSQLTAVAVGVQDTWQAQLSNTLTFELVTREGDRVQVSVRQKLGAMQQSTLVAAGATDGGNTALVGSLSQLQAGLFQADIGIHVQGNLNEDEMKALQEVMKQVGALVQDFFSGDMQAAVDDLGSMHFDKSQLASFDLDMHQRIQVRHSQQTAVQIYQETARPSRGRGPVHPQVQQLRIQQWQAQMVEVERSLSAHFKFADVSVEGMVAALGSEDAQSAEQLEQVVRQLRQQMADLLGIRLQAPDEKQAENADDADSSVESVGEPKIDSTASPAGEALATPTDGAPESAPVESSAARAEANTPRPETSTA